MVLHDQPGVLFAQRLLSGDTVSIPSPDRIFRRPLELRLQAAALGLARWQFLGRWQSHCEWRGKYQYFSNKLPHRGDNLNPFEQAPESQNWLQRRHLHQVWRELSERIGGVAVFLAGQAQLAIWRLVSGQ